MQCSYLSSNWSSCFLAYLAHLLKGIALQTKTANENLKRVAELQICCDNDLARINQVMRLNFKTERDDFSETRVEELLRSSSWLEAIKYRREMSADRCCRLRPANSQAHRSCHARCETATDALRPRYVLGCRRLRSSPRKSLSRIFSFWRIERAQSADTTQGLADGFPMGFLAGAYNQAALVRQCQVIRSAAQVASIRIRSPCVRIRTRRETSPISDSSSFSLNRRTTRESPVSLVPGPIGSQSHY